MNEPNPASTASKPETATAAQPAPATGGEGYQVIARRYRPRFFHEVVGQEATAETLKQAIAKNRLAHAYLFCGPRGVGKTSMARILARVLQCENVQDGNPCDRCDSCERIFRGEDMDVVEMDGASNRGIDDIRALIEHVRFAPSGGHYRIFIIDEVHMLTREAFNALLKTLEEPPAHVKFVFATTEPEKVLATVISRCQRYDFSAISQADLVRRLEQICEAEGAKPQDGLLARVADLARGGMRDSQSLLDQLLSFSGLEPSLADLDRITGRLAPEQISVLLDRIESGDRAGVVREVHAIEIEGNDPAVVLEQVIEELRRRLHRGVSESWGDAEIEKNLLAQEILQEARFRMRQLGRAEVVLELALLRLSTLSDLMPLGEVIDRVRSGAGSGAAGSPGTGSPGSGSPGSGSPGAGAPISSRKSDATGAPPGKPERVVPGGSSGGPRLSATPERSPTLSSSASMTAEPRDASPRADSPPTSASSFGGTEAGPSVESGSVGSSPEDSALEGNVLAGRASSHAEPSVDPSSVSRLETQPNSSVEPPVAVEPTPTRRPDPRMSRAPDPDPLPSMSFEQTEDPPRDLSGPFETDASPEPRSEPDVGVRQPPEPVRADDPPGDSGARGGVVDSVRECLTRVSPTLARLVGDRVVFDAVADRLTITLSEEGKLFADGRRLDELQREVSDAMGRRIPVQVAIAKVAEVTEAIQEVRATHETNTDVPDIVQKAVEIFRGTMR